MSEWFKGLKVAEDLTRNYSIIYADNYFITDVYMMKGQSFCNGYLDYLSYYKETLCTLKE